jgi:hypothetical protein
VSVRLELTARLTLCRCTAFTYIIAAICWSYGPPHRKPIWNNFILAASIVILTAFSEMPRPRCRRFTCLTLPPQTLHSSSSTRKAPSSTCSASVCARCALSRQLADAPLSAVPCSRAPLPWHYLWHRARSGQVSPGVCRTLCSL